MSTSFFEARQLRESLLLQSGIEKDLQRLQARSYERHCCPGLYPEAPPLGEVEMRFFALTYFENDLYSTEGNPLLSYFHGGGGAFCDAALRGLDDLDLPVVRDALSSARRLLLGAAGIPNDDDERRATVTKAATQDVRDELKALASTCWAQTASLVERRIAYAVENRLVEVADASRSSPEERTPAVAAPKRDARSKWDPLKYVLVAVGTMGLVMWFFSVVQAWREG